MANDILIRVDGCEKIGLGHIYRCIALAYMLERDFKTTFFCTSIPSPLKKIIINNGWGFESLDNENEFVRHLSETDIVILDGYQFGTFFQKQIKEKGCKLVCIDDFHDQYFYADLVINHAPGVSEHDYKGEAYTKYLLGPDFALLRPEFLKSKPYVKRNNSNNIKNIFICFGGSDSENLTGKILSWLPNEGYSVTVVLGNAFIHLEELKKIIETRKDLFIDVKNSLSANEIKQELEQADLAVVPASGISLEALVVGVPSIIGYYTTNQVSIYKGLVHKKGFYDAFDFSKENFKNAFRAATESYQVPENVDSSNISLRIRKEFNRLKSQLELKLREATDRDIDDLYLWAIDPTTRKNSYNQEEIDYESHVKWARNKLSSSDCVLLIFENTRDQKIGFVRFDKDEQEKWVISINIAPLQRGKGYSVELLRRALSYFGNVRGKEVVKAYIKKVNIASVKAFERAGFEVQEGVNIKGEESILMIWK